MKEENNVFSVFLSIGSNLGDRKKNIGEAYKKIEKQIGEIKSSSAFFYSPPEGFTSDNYFINTVCEVITNIDVYRLFAITQNIEKELGRVEKSVNNEYSDRVMDIDILLVNNMIINSSELTIPHPKFHERNFVLTPLNEIAPEIIHPVLKKPISVLKEELESKVK